MTDETLIIETEDGKQFIANIKSMDFEVNMREYGQRATSIEEREYHFKVGKLLQTNE